MFPPKTFGQSNNSRSRKKANSITRGITRLVQIRKAGKPTIKPIYELSNFPFASSKNCS